MKSLPALVLFGAGLAMSAGQAAAAEIAYISSSSGYMLNSNGSIAVTANWAGQAPIQGFSGYGPIQMNGRCLTGKAGSQPLTWEGCRRGGNVVSTNGSNIIAAGGGNIIAAGGGN